MNIPKEIAEELNPENKKLTAAQWQRKYEKYLQEQERKGKVAQQNGERPGVCDCGNTKFHLRVLSGGKIQRTCKNELCRKVRLI